VTACIVAGDEVEGNKREDVVVEKVVKDESGDDEMKK
jgi:hypothetical protein